MAIDDEALAAIDRLEQTITGLRGDVQALRRRWRWMSWAAAIAAVVLLVAGINLRYSLHQADCVRDLVNQSADRSNTLSPVFFAKVTAEDAFFKSLQSKDKTLETRLYEQMIKAEAAYDQAFAANPVPQAPHYAC